MKVTTKASIYWGATAQEAQELDRLLYKGEIITAIRKLLLVQHLDAAPDVDSLHIQDFHGDDGLVFNLYITTDILNQVTVQFRFFLEQLVPKQNFGKVDEDAGLKDKNLSWANLVKLRILYVVGQEVKYFSKQANADKVCSKKLHNATVWTQSPNGSMGRTGGIR